ncbi:DUF6153 family protein [Janibacter anophelis]|uniref:DUF6153 family protein n=1 Tax=Janibacter anophelis TaxID=319054 RepID=UPI0008361A03|nr:DUF6153 family protein [Janibacter anophelis]
MVLLALASTVVAGILAMHGFAVGHHGAAPAPVDRTSTSAAQAGHHGHGTTAGELAAPFDTSQAPAPAPGGTMHDSCPVGPCGDVGSAGAACLFVLLSLTLALPGRGRALWSWRPPRASAVPLPAWGADRQAPPRELLTRLCVCRT